MAKLVTFDSIAGVPCYYARTNAAYADLDKCTPGRRRKLHPTFLAICNAAIAEINMLTAPYLGPLVALTSGGAYVEKPGAHRLGRGYDLGGLHWRAAFLTCLDVAQDDPADQVDDYLLYLAVESVLRKWFGTVLGIHYNAAHANHFHLDNLTRAGYLAAGRLAPSRVRYLQETLTWVWDSRCGTPDGIEGKKTRKALAAWRKRHGVGLFVEPDNWQRYLSLTALRALMLR
ncbi:MAG: extensin family protein [Gammaproteobacteria bacterium]|nr:extensin family protein [Gammaproteobacteria bacterium]